MKGIQSDLKILVAGGCRQSLHPIFDYLNKMGIQPCYAETGNQAIELACSECPDIILLDEIFPDMDASSIAKQVRKQERNKNWTAIIFLTDLSDESNLMLGINSGGNDYLLKPISEIAFKAKILTIQRLVDLQHLLFDLTCRINYKNNLLSQIAQH